MNKCSKIKMEGNIKAVLIMVGILVLTGMFAILVVWPCKTRSFDLRKSNFNALENTSRLEASRMGAVYMFGSKTVEKEIIFWSKVYDFNPKTALRIAHCESTTGKYLHNKNSSAKGVYQFTDKTWKNYCEGYVLNQTDNIRCFMELYPGHQCWWECK